MFMEKDIAWLKVIGINENGVDGLSGQARAIISAAGLVVGGKRHLELAGGLVKGQSLIWDSPIEKTIEKIIERKPQNTCVLASGDPFSYGIGATLARHIAIEEMLVIPAPSCFSLAAARLGWALQNTVTIGLNGRHLEKIIPHLQPGAKILALSTDETTPISVFELIYKRGLAAAKLQVMEHLGGEKEKIYEFHGKENIARLNMIALEIPADLTGKAIPITSGLPDKFFENDGQLTKREIRAITLSSLAPRKGELLWDIGLGAGSIAIEWLLANPANRAIGFEKDTSRAKRALLNAVNLGVPDLQIIEGVVPHTLEGRETPDAIFIGGGAKTETIDAAWNALKTGGRMVVNSITLETESTIISAYKKYGGNIIRIGIDRDEDVGNFTGLRPAMRVMQWSAIK